jgi:hypothetical protein
MTTHIKTTSIKLAINYADSLDIPIRFREKKSENEKKINFNTQIERNFQEKVNDWEKTLTILLQNVETDLAWSFINNKPQKENNIKSAAYHSQFKIFTDYLILRRDKENCENGELSCLALLHTSFQKEIDDQLKA